MAPVGVATPDANCFAAIPSVTAFGAACITLPAAAALPTPPVNIAPKTCPNPCENWSVKEPLNSSS